MRPSDTFQTPSVEITKQLATELVRLGGYTHPLFADPDFIPGQAVLLLLGGLVEQTDRFDETVVAMLGMDDVKFTAPARVGDTIQATVEVLEENRRETTRTLVMAWTAINQDNVKVAESTVTMLFRIQGEK